MAHAALTSQPRTPPDATLPPGADALAMLQLRHHTKNALQRVIAQVATAGLRATPAGCTLADDIERRICLSAQVSDALFGLTTAPGPLANRLQSMCEATIALMSDIEQTILSDVVVAGSCPSGLETTLVQIAHEMVGNAVKHGMHMRLVGRIAIRARAEREGVTLLVSDNGWGPGDARYGQGLPIMRALAERHCGDVTLHREDGWTVARLHIPL